MRDTVRYAIGFGPLGELAHRVLVRRDLEAIFDFRAQASPEAAARREAQALRRLTAASASTMRLTPGRSPG